MSGRAGRRFTAMGAGAALVATGLSLGVMAPANAASALTGGVTDGFGNSISGKLSYYRQDIDGTLDLWGESFVGSDGYIEGTLSDGAYKFEFDTASGVSLKGDKTDKKGTLRRLVRLSRR